MSFRVLFPAALRLSSVSRSLALSVLLATSFSVSQAAPSGGPYGPVARHYEVPKNAAHVYYVAPDGKPDAAGTSVEQPIALAAAFEKAVTGDAVILRGGVYRVGGLKLNQGITLQPFGDEKPILKGTEVAATWEAQPNGLWRASWSHLFPAKAQDWWRRPREGRKTSPWRFNNDMVFVNGKMLRAVGWEGEIDADSYFIDYDNGQVYIGVDPKDKLVEITAHDSAITRTIGELRGKPSDKIGPKIFGITFTQYAYRALEFEGNEPTKLADPATFGKDIVGTLIENVTISHCSRVAGYFRGDHFTMRHCLISDTSTEGVYVIGSADVLLEKNIFRRNNVESITGYYASAVKIFNQSYRCVIRDNLLTENPNSSGIWFDVGNVDGLFVDNWVQETNDGFFFEISKGAVCTGNVFVNCNKGVRILNSSNVQVSQNTFVNSLANFERTERSAVGDHFGWHPSTGPAVEERHGHVFKNNLLVAGESFRGPMIQFDQTQALCGRLTDSQAKEFDRNVYVRSGAIAGEPLVAWSPVEGKDCKTTFETLDGLRKLHPEFEAHSKYFTNYDSAVFQSTELSRLNVAASFPGAQIDGATVGAYPVFNDR
ncbi:MAG TPA: right-handed parallel beta-helix repeat-containing protein [Opitutaceae bacterium]|nr:right-handed parallel beta-helix repeat-containing protein [Opitutaceae bacterium]